MQCHVIMPPVPWQYTLKSLGKNHSNLEGSRSMSSHNLHKYGTQNWVTLSSSLSAALFSDISLLWPIKLFCTFYPILTHPSQASVYDRGLRTGSTLGGGQGPAADKVVGERGAPRGLWGEQPLDPALHDLHSQPCRHQWCSTGSTTPWGRFRVESSILVQLCYLPNNNYCVYLLLVFHSNILLWYKGKLLLSNRFKYQKYSVNVL